MRGYNRANAIIPQMQIDSNLKVVAAIPGWQEQKGRRNGYVMLTTLHHGTLRPTILVLDVGGWKPSGRLSYRQLHQQIREALQLETKHSLRLCSFRPWYRYMTRSFSHSRASRFAGDRCSVYAPARNDIAVLVLRALHRLNWHASCVPERRVREAVLHSRISSPICSTRPFEPSSRPLCTAHTGTVSEERFKTRNNDKSY